jgi:AsmA protein
MKKPFRISLIIISSIFGLFMLLAILLSFIFDPNNYRDTITHQIEQKTGRTLTLGDIELSFFPWFGIHVGDIELSNATGFSPPQTVLLKTLKLHFKVLPLFRGQIQVGEITLDNLTVSLARNKKGMTNWDDLLHKLQQDDPPKPIEHRDNKPHPVEKKSNGKQQKTSTVAENKNIPLPLFVIENIYINNAELVWKDAKKNLSYQIKQLNLSLGALQTQKFAPLEASFKFISDQPEANGTIKLSSLIDVNPVSQRVRLRDIKLHESIQSKLIPGGLLDIKTQAKAINLLIDKQILEVTELETHAYNTQINSTARITSLFNNPTYEASVKLTPFSPRKLAQSLKIHLPESTDPNVFDIFALNTQIKGDTHTLKLQSIDLKLDSSTVKGEIQLHFKRNPLITFNLAVNQLDVDRNLPPNKKQIKKISTKLTPSPKIASTATRVQKEIYKVNSSPYIQTSLTKPNPATQNKIIPFKSPTHALAGLTKFDLDGILRFKKLKVNQLRLQQVSMPVKNKNGLMRLNPLKANLYQGTSRSDITIITNRTQPQFKLKQQLTNIQLGPLLKDLLGEAKASGKTNITANLTTKGLSEASIKSNLNGNATFKLVDGEVKGINIPEMKRKIETALKQQAAPPASEEATAFSDANGSVVITNGIIINKDLRATVSHARIGGMGQVSLPANTIDYTLLVKFTSEASAQSGTTYDQMDKAALPVHVRGALNDPSIKPDYEALLSDLATRELRKHESRLKKQLEDELNKKIADELEKLFNKK